MQITYRTVRGLHYIKAESCRRWSRCIPAGLSRVTQGPAAVDQRLFLGYVSSKGLMASSGYPVTLVR